MAKRLEQLNFDDPSVEETIEHQRRAEEIELGERCETYLNEERLKRYSNFLNAVRQSRINVENVYANIPVKMRHLKDIMGYDVLIGKDGKAVKLKDAKSSRIGKAYLHTYNQARKYFSRNK